MCFCTCIHFLNCCSLLLHGSKCKSQHLGHNNMCWGPRGEFVHFWKGVILPGLCLLCSLLCTAGIWPTVTNINIHLSLREGESIQLRNSPCCKPWLSPHSSNRCSYSFRNLFQRYFPKPTQPQAAQTSAGGHKCSKAFQTMITETRLGHQSVWDGTLFGRWRSQPCPKGFLPFFTLSLHPAHGSVILVSSLLQWFIHKVFWAEYWPFLRIKPKGVHAPVWEKVVLKVFVVLSPGEVCRCSL